MNKNEGIKGYLDNKQKYSIEKGTVRDIDALESLYDDLNDYLESGINYCGWKKGIYPVRETAIIAIKANTLFVIKYELVL